LIRKQIRFLHVMLVSTFLAFIIACLATLIIWIMM
jgi:preprotein translocase subunit SecE